jgi:hypothetical protein
MERAVSTRPDELRTQADVFPGKLYTDSPEYKQKILHDAVELAVTRHDPFIMRRADEYRRQQQMGGVRTRPWLSFVAPVAGVDRSLSRTARSAAIGQLDGSPSAKRGSCCPEPTAPLSSRCVFTTCFGFSKNASGVASKGGSGKTDCAGHGTRANAVVVRAAAPNPTGLPAPHQQCVAWIIAKPIS